MTFNIDTIVIFMLVVVCGLLTAEIFRLNQRLRKIFIGKNAEDLEDSVVEIIKHIRDLELHGGKVDTQLGNIEARLKKSIQKCQTVRFNPFPDQGGNQSFSTCFMDEQGDGVVISSLYARDKVGIYAKPLNKFQSEFELSQEEKEAITKSK